MIALPIMHVVAVLLVAGISFAAGVPVVGFLAVAAAVGLIVFYIKITDVGTTNAQGEKEAR